MDGGRARATLPPVGDIHEGAAGKVVGDGAAVGRVDKGARILGRSWVPARDGGGVARRWKPKAAAFTK